MYGGMILALVISAIVIIAPALNPPCCQIGNDMESSATVETNSGCTSCLSSAEIWEFENYPGDYSDLDFVSDVTNHVKWQDGWYISFNKNYLLRVHLNKYLDKGDMIVIYAKWNTVPAIKSASIYLTNGTKVGGGDVFSHWNYYTLNITGNIPPTNTFDIVINGGNPSSNQIKIDKVKCMEGEPEPPEPTWRDPYTGVPIYNYSVNFNYMVTVDGNVDTSEVYLDLEIRQNVTDDNAANATIHATLFEMETIHVSAVNTSLHYESSVVSIIDHAIAGTDNITIRINVDATAYGKIEGTQSWIVIAKTYISLREINAWWY